MKHDAAMATMSFLLSCASRQLYGSGKLVIEHSFGDGLFCHDDKWKMYPRQRLQKLHELLNEWLANEIPLKYDTIDCSQAIMVFEEAGLRNKPELLRMWQQDKFPIIRFGEFWDICLEPMNLDKSSMRVFELRNYNHGFLLRLAPRKNPEVLAPYLDRPKLFYIFREHQRWIEILGVKTIAQLNNLVRQKVRELVWVSDGLHDKKLSEIADQLVEQHYQRPVLFISGPSASGKTTFAKRLAIQLLINGYTTRQISMDDYFVNRDDIPVGPDGSQDFEALTVLNMDLLAERVETLLDGGAVPERKFDFRSGMGRDLDETYSLRKKEFLLLEGIHGLNPILTQRVAPGAAQKIYVSAITQLNFDGDHRVSTADNRLIRRLVRDHRTRGYSPEDTLARWPSVRQGEERNIFPYQEEADFMFNSVLLYEFSMLTRLARPLLDQVSADSPHAAEAKRLVTLLSFFEPMDDSLVPRTSILREFIGGSDF